MEAHNKDRGPVDRLCSRIHSTEPQWRTPLWELEQQQLSSHCLLTFPYYAPNFGEVEGAYWFGPVRPSVCPSVKLGSWETQEPLMLESWNYIYGMYMKNKRTCIFLFLHQSCHSGVMPLFRLCMKNLANRISEELLRLGSWYLACSYRPRCRWTD